MTGGRLSYVDVYLCANWFALMNIEILIEISSTIADWYLAPRPVSVGIYSPNESNLSTQQYVISRPINILAYRCLWFWKPVLDDCKETSLDIHTKIYVRI